MDTPKSLDTLFRRLADGEPPPSPARTPRPAPTPARSNGHAAAPAPWLPHLAAVRAALDAAARADGARERFPKAEPGPPAASVMDDGSESPAAAPSLQDRLRSLTAPALSIPIPNSAFGWGTAIPAEEPPASPEFTLPLPDERVETVEASDWQAPEPELPYQWPEPEEDDLLPEEPSDFYAEAPSPPAAAIPDIAEFAAPPRSSLRGGDEVCEFGMRDLSDTAVSVEPGSGLAGRPGTASVGRNGVVRRWKAALEVWKADLAALGSRFRRNGGWWNLDWHRLLPALSFRWPTSGAQPAIAARRMPDRSSGRHFRESGSPARMPRLPASSLGFRGVRPSRSVSAPGPPADFIDFEQPAPAAPPPPLAAPRRERRFYRRAAVTAEIAIDGRACRLLDLSQSGFAAAEAPPELAPGQSISVALRMLRDGIEVGATLRARLAYTAPARTAGRFIDLTDAQQTLLAHLLERPHQGGSISPAAFIEAVGRRARGCTWWTRLRGKTRR